MKPSFWYGMSLTIYLTAIVILMVTNTLSGNLLGWGLLTVGWILFMTTNTRVSRERRERYSKFMAEMKERIAASQENLERLKKGKGDGETKPGDGPQEP